MIFAMMPKTLVIASVAAGLAALAAAQTGPRPAAAPAAPKTYGTLYLKSNVGSFKVLSPGEVNAEGKFSMDFNGSVLVSELVGTATPGPGVRLEYPTDKASPAANHNKRVFFGKGHLTIDGKFRAIQFFGRDLKAEFHGFGIVRLYGEFDKNLDTGEFWYKELPDHQPWGSGGRTLTNPPAPTMGPAPVKGKLKDINGKG